MLKNQDATSSRKPRRFTTQKILGPIVQIFVATLLSAASANGQGLMGQGLIPSSPRDEAMRSFLEGKMPESQVDALYQGADEDYFADMDGGITKPENTEQMMDSLGELLPSRTAEEVRQSVIRGRNNWNVWSGGNDRFWNHLGKAGFGQLDFLKTISNHPNASTTRSQRWKDLGLVNEPCFEENMAPRKDRWGLWLDTRSERCAPDPFENMEKYPGVQIGARGQTLEFNGEPIKHDSSFYGWATGVIGLRLFPNPDFDKKAAKKWDPQRYYNDPAYFNNPKLVKPYRVGMACVFCHVGPSPTNPPKDFANPAWENLSSTVGSQYYWVDRVYFWNYKKNKNNLIYQLLHTARPGSLDTSLISSDQINNPRTMNAIYDFKSRLKTSVDFHHKEDLKSYNRENKQYNHFLDTLIPELSPLHDLATSDRDLLLAPRRYRLLSRRTQGKIEVTSPRILKDGSDSVGVLAAVNRVYANIGQFSEEWLTHFIPLIGGRNLTPFDLRVAKRNSIYWTANTAQTPDVSLFLTAASTPHRLPAETLAESDLELLDKGKTIFAQKCAACHSSKLPKTAMAFFEDPSCKGKGYLKCWNNYWTFANNDPDFQKQTQDIVHSETFLDENYLSTELRVPVSLLGVQTCSSEATNGIKNDIWANFTSDSYKALPSAGAASIVTLNPAGQFVTGQRRLPAGGRGFIRPPSLASLWSTAPYFGNNSLGVFEGEGTTEGRLQSFEISLKRLLNPETRVSNRGYTAYSDDESEETNNAQKVVTYKVGKKTAKGVVDVFSENTYIQIPRAYIPRFIYAILPKSLKVRPPKRKPSKSRLSLKDGMPIPVFESEIPEEKTYGLMQLEMENGYDLDTPPLTKKEMEAAVLEALGESLVLGPFPKGFPINLVSNIDLSANPFRLLGAVRSLLKGFKAVKRAKNPEQALANFTRLTAKSLNRVSKCPDLVVNKGHYFGTGYGPDADNEKLTDDEQRALIEFLKRF